jgi:1-aminocyclopropane-1-carboxylate deaminase/D-cysteine desulfhydrase-like pyridoxal-dependent ACC family enzyme
MPRLGEHLGIGRLLVKRDDLTGLAFGGNKARKLERLCRDARDTGCDVLVTGGGLQSNHARMTAAAAARLGLACHLVLGGEPRAPRTANLLLDRLFGATLHFAADAGEYYALEAAIERVGEELAATGRKPYVIPIGGASAVGVAAYADAGDELVGQLEAAGVDQLDTVVVADGSGGTHAGLLAGLPATTTVVGVDVGTRPDLDVAVPRLAAAAAAARGREHRLGPVVVDHARVGDGYGAWTPTGRDALRVTARLEGLALDPVYTAKAMAGLIGGVGEGGIDPGGTILFWHTGGAVALFAERYAQALSTI